MKNIVAKLFRDEAGFIVSSELILVATIAVLSLVVGLAEVSHGVNQELEDVGSAVGSFQQSYSYRGLYSHDKSAVVGSYFSDERDFCDSQYDIAATPAVSENDRHGHDND